jgi:hypothetical protein
MKVQVKQWLLGLVMLFVFAGILTPLQADAADAHIVVSVGHSHHRHYRRHYVYYRHHRHYRHDYRDRR